ncbi:hypothetical protein ccbrp13_56160 [Ktedonobacteria bacterium brp13]|nr:hypothetical protein ccbrp13_56160 [Ktedonobacteria bacterium brp13]
MPTLSTKWDIVSAFEHFANIQTVGREGDVHGVSEIHANCPWCPGSKDSFILRRETGQFTHAVRSGGCGASGDIIDLLTSDLVGMTRQEALIEAEIEDVQFSDQEPNTRHVNSKDVAPSKKWQEAATLIMQRAERFLWHTGSKTGKQALEYLHSRGLKDETIKKAHIGYVPLMPDGQWYQGSFEDWGLNPDDFPTKDCVKVASGILIPWFVGGQVWKLAVKRPGQEHDYIQVDGSSEPLYGVDGLQYGEICMMVEGEIDCLSVQQEAGDLLNCVATGSSAKGRSGRWITELSLASFILQSFDEDPSGDDGAKFWLDTFELESNIARWSPMSWNDPNALLQAQGEAYITLREWARLGVEMARYNMRIATGHSSLAREAQASVEDHFELDEEAIADAEAW